MLHHSLPHALPEEELVMTCSASLAYCCEEPSENKRNDGLVVFEL